MAELEKVDLTSSAEPNFIQILCQIYPVFRQLLTKFYQILPKLTKFFKFNLICCEF